MLQPRFLTNPTRPKRCGRRRRLLVGWLLLLALPPLFGNGLNLPLPLRQDNDAQPIALPAESNPAEAYSFIYNTWLRHLELDTSVARMLDRPALNLNAWDEVPDSSWFTSRIGSGPLRYENILESLNGKPPQLPFKIVSFNAQGITPKFVVQDADGREYFLKFDFPDRQERNSAAEVISTLILYASGYNVPFNSIVSFRAQDLEPNGTIEPDKLQELLQQLKGGPTGLYRGVASQKLEGKPIGPFAYTGRRKDDKNDLIPHELRRDLRGLYVISSWINHTDIKKANTLDVFVETSPAKGFVQHYLIDFGSTLGAAYFDPERSGYEYIIDAATIGKSFFSLGVWRRPWDSVTEPHHPSVGFYSTDFFKPQSWRPNYPNLAFRHMDDGDAYWGAKIVTAFGDKLLGRLATAGQYSDPRATDYLVKILRERRDIIGRYWFAKVTPLEEIKLTRQGNRYQLSFTDLAVERRYSDRTSRCYQYWVESVQGKTLLQPAQTCGEQPIEIDPQILQRQPGPADAHGRRPSTVLVIQARDQASPEWARPVRVVVGEWKTAGSLETLGWRHGIDF